MGDSYHGGNIMQYNVTLNGGAEINIDAVSAEAAMLEATDRGEQVASAELELDAVTITTLDQVTDREEVVAVASELARKWGDNTPHCVIGILSQAIASRNAGE